MPRCATRPGLRAFLDGLATMPDFFAVCATLDEVRPDRPFYPVRGIAGMTRLAHARALGLLDAAALSRHCDRATAERPAGAPLFWTLGANQSGKAAIAAWRALIMPALVTGTALRLWPFDGAFRSLLAPGSVAMAETYPAEALRHLGIRLRGSKRRHSDRAATAGALLAAMDALSGSPDRAMRRAILDGFGADAAGEDRFDSVLGVLVRDQRAGRQSPGYRPGRPVDQSLGRLGPRSDGTAGGPAGLRHARHRPRDLTAADHYSAAFAFATRAKTFSRTASGKPLGSTGIS